MNQNITQASGRNIPSSKDIAPVLPLALEEILRFVFQFAERASLYRAARVSRAWSDIALEELWGSLPSIFPLLRLLAPLKWILDPTTYHNDLVLSLAEANWNRFREYSLRIRCVNVDYGLEADLPFDSAALVQMVSRTAPLLPNVQAISWRFIQTKNCTSVLPFIGPQLERLELVMERDISGSEQMLVVQSLVDHSPNLRSLRLVSFTLVHGMNYSLAALISSSPKLVHLELPAFFLTPEIVTAAAELPLLTKLNYSHWTSTSETYSEYGMSFKSDAGMFQELDSLSFASLPRRVTDVLAHWLVTQLQTISVDCPSFGSPYEIQNIFSYLAAGTERLTDVQLVCCPVPQLRNRSSNASLSTTNIRPLFSCTRLKRFHLLAPHFIPLQENDIVAMGTSWPEMRSLTLCPAPLVHRHQGTHYNMLSAIARNFPNLRKLRLYLGPGIEEFDGNLYPAYRLGRLETLGVGFSVVPRGKAQEIGFLLASLCQNSPVIEVGVTKYHRGGDLPEQERSDLLAGWSEVISAMNLAFRTKSSIAPMLRTTALDAEPWKKTL